MAEESPQCVPSFDANGDASLSHLDLLLSAALSSPPENIPTSPYTDASHPTATSTSICYRKHFDDLYHLLRPDHRPLVSPETSSAHMQCVPDLASNHPSTGNKTLPRAFTVSTTSSRSKRKTHPKPNDNKRGRSFQPSVLETTSDHTPFFMSNQPGDSPGTENTDALCPSVEIHSKKEPHTPLLVPGETLIDDDFVPAYLENTTPRNEPNLEQSHSQQNGQRKDDAFLNYLDVSDESPPHSSFVSSSPVTVFHASSSPGFRSRHNFSG